ncbi:hypothetical protein KAM472_41740 [Aeromonas caviae]|nr:hypothetical protein KAM462_41510 [Aeromonas caviae]GKR12679.1 hypothetical protein KAM465_42560 [Aeromonas caviae]GKR16952.1 hypothetical protein KAM466_42700 [Aeromonas caviae]GKR42478.1 hypothetical protein KAM472_41740 [Aeromonas caviae]
MYTIGSTYTRNDIYEILGLPENERGGDWLNGYHRHGEDYYIFCNIGVPGRTGHDYDNHWEGEKLIWYLITHDPQPASRADMASEGLPRLHAPIQPTCS